MIAGCRPLAEKTKAVPVLVRLRPVIGAGGFILLLVLLAMLRPVDHDESQYVAATVLAASGLPYRDFAYFQTPLQPLLLAPIAMLGGQWTWPALRLINTFFGIITLISCYGAARAGGARQSIAIAATMLFASCDIFLYTAAIARNDALPAACLSVALWLHLRRPGHQRSPLAAMLTGALLATAAATKISFAIPAIAYGVYALAHRGNRPGLVAVGVAPIAVAVFGLYLAAPDAFVFDVFTFAVRAPIEWYRQANPWKLTLLAKAIDAIKFLLLGPAFLALLMLARSRVKPARASLLIILTLAGLVGALLPSPTWRQYLIPVLPPLFVWLALAWEAQPPDRAWRVAMIVCAAAGWAPTIEGILLGGNRMTIAQAMRESAIIGQAASAVGVAGPVASLAPQLLPGAGLTIDPRFAAGPYYFRSDHLLNDVQERALHLVSRRRMNVMTPLPAAVLIGGEGPWAGSDTDELPILEDYLRSNRWRRVPMPSERFRLYLPPQ